MDQLKQVLKYQFWILLGVALILPLVGWMMATSGLLSEAEGRTKTLTDLNKSLNSNSDDPNKEWESGLEVINGTQGKQPKIAAKELYDHQLPLMTWPSKMPSDPAKFLTRHQEYYRTAYKDFIEDVRKIVKPYDEDAQTGLVVYNEDLLPTPHLSEWVSQAPSVKQIEAAQEDLWLLSAILKQIAAVNEDAATPFEAAVRQINELYLRGGSKAGGGGSSKSTSTSTGGGGGGGGGAKVMNTEMVTKSLSMANALSGGMAGRNAGGGDAGNAIASAKINPDDDLGPELAAPSEKAAETKSSTTTSSSSKAPGGGMMEKMMANMPSIGLANSGSSSSASSGARWSGSSMGRYRDDKNEYRTRGFYLEVVMDHTRIPELLAALANADWPITVLRVQESDFKDEDLADGGGGGGGLPSMGGRSMGSAMMMPKMGSGGSRGGMGGPPPGMMKTPGAGFKAPGGRSAGELDDGSMNNRSALDDPNLANVAIVGLIYIFKKPPEEKTAATPPASPPPSAAPGGTTAPVASAPSAAGAPGTAAADPSNNPPAAAAADSKTAADDDTAGEQADPAAAAENKPESKSEEQEDSPVNEVNEGPPEKPAPEKTVPEKTGPGKS